MTLFRDREVYKEPENPKLATWKQDLDRRLLELEEAAAVRISPIVRCVSARDALAISWASEVAATDSCRPQASIACLLAACLGLQWLLVGPCECGLTLQKHVTGHAEEQDSDRKLTIRCSM